MIVLDLTALAEFDGLGLPKTEDRAGEAFGGNLFISADIQGRLLQILQLVFCSTEVMLYCSAM